MFAPPPTSLICPDAHGSDVSTLAGVANHHAVGHIIGLYTFRSTLWVIIWIGTSFLHLPRPDLILAVQILAMGTWRCFIAECPPLRGSPAPAAPTLYEGLSVCHQQECSPLCLWSSASFAPLGSASAPRQLWDLVNELQLLNLHGFEHCLDNRHLPLHNDWHVP